MALSMGPKSGVVNLEPQASVDWERPKEKQIRVSQALEKDGGRNLTDSWPKQHRNVEEIPNGTRDDKAYWKRAPNPRGYVAF
ncbi:hypothetical protein DPMN_007473 [Dreissena polymorpha]|uniref:Uncharacterized protein n=1 Tax=Dreissena polymorpha TaxID=45954 RepID=A0A9D4RWG2_DREPO|nr:hypothetical protein DPMN_007473 [Dreissena polymorpha]